MSTQAGLFDDLAPAAEVSPSSPCTTAIYPNRVSDKAKVERRLGLQEHGSEDVIFLTSKGTVIATGYVRIVYGDHGPYIELRREQIACKLVPKFNNPLPESAYYEWLVPDDGSGLKVYDQKRDVKNVRNAPAGGVAASRVEGYAGYIPGMIYLSPWDAVIEQVSPQSRPAVASP